MSTNATFTWIPQASIVAQEVWYGRLTDVGSTLPPGTGWNQGSNLYTATAGTALINNLNENTIYRFLVESHCSTGDSGWAEKDGYKLVCPTVTTTLHATSVDASLAIFNPGELAKIVNTLTLSIQNAGTGTILNSSAYSGTGIVSPINLSFGGLTPSSNYNIIVSYTLTPNGTSTVCSTTAVTTSPSATCPVITFNTSGITTTNFIVTPFGLVAGDTYDISLDGGTTFLYINATQPSQTISALTPGTTYQVVIRRNCQNGTNSVTAATPVTLIGIIAGSLSMNSDTNAVGTSANGTLYLLFNFSAPTPAPVTLYFGYTHENRCDACGTGKCSWSNGFDIFTPPAGAQNCPGSVIGSGGSVYYGGQPHYPFTITIPQGVTTFNSGTNIHTTNPAPTLPNLPWENEGGGVGSSARGFTDIYVKVASPSNYIANFTIISGTNISGVTIHNV